MSEAPSNTESGTEVRTYFVRGRNALVARAEFSELYASLYLHQLDTGAKHESAVDELLRDAIAAVTLHCASRPRTETVAWTVNFQSPLANIFAGGNNRLETVVGNAFTEGVKESENNLFFADVVTENQPSRRSVVEFEGNDFLRAAESFYSQSEQRPVRLFRFDEEDLVLVAAQPDCDLEWLASLNDETIRRLDQDETLSLLEQRMYRFECGCNQNRMLEMLAPVMKKQPDELFGGEETIRVSCPRCGARYTITRESLEAKLASEPDNR